MPADLKTGQDEQKIIEILLEQYKRNTELKLGIKENIGSFDGEKFGYKKRTKFDRDGNERID